MAKLATLKEDFDEPESCWFRYMQSQKKITESILGIRQTMTKVYQQQF